MADVGLGTALAVHVCTRTHRYTRRNPHGFPHTKYFALFTFLNRRQEELLCQDFAQMQMWTFAPVHICARAQMHVCTIAHIHSFMRAHTHTLEIIAVNNLICIQHKHTHTHTCIRIYICTCTVSLVPFATRFAACVGCLAMLAQ